MSIKNYTSGVPSSRTVARIEEILAENGAEGIQKHYEEKRLTGLIFRITPPGQRTIEVRLPTNAKAVYETMRKEMKKPRKGTLAKLEDQAERTSWKLMQDWVEVQISLIKMNQVERHGSTTWVHRSSPVWVTKYEVNDGRDFFVAYKSIVNVPNGREPWTVNNKRLCEPHRIFNLEKALELAEVSA